MRSLDARLLFTKVVLGRRMVLCLYRTRRLAWLTLRVARDYDVVLDA